MTAAQGYVAVVTGPLTRSVEELPTLRLDINAQRVGGPPLASGVTRR
jgi:hypothetical protein